MQKELLQLESKLKEKEKRLTKLAKSIKKKKAVLARLKERQRITEQKRTLDSTQILNSWLNLRPVILKNGEVEEYYCYFCPYKTSSIRKFCKHCISKIHRKNKEIIFQSIINR